MLHTFQRLVVAALAVWLGGVASPALAGNNFTLSNGTAGEINYSPAVTRNSTDQPIGVFSLDADGAGSTLADVTIRLTGVRTGLSNFKTWTSTDASFNSVTDTQKGATIAVDPGIAGMVFGGTFPMPLGKTYLFLTADVDSGATGTVQANVISISSNATATLQNFTPPEAMSTGAIPLPVSVSEFTVE